MQYSKLELVEKGLEHKRESKYVEFKAQFDGTDKAWCDLVKEIVALANTKGGVVMIGLDNTGQPSGRVVQPILDTDPEQITDKINKYTGVQFDGISIFERTKDGQQVAALTVQRAGIPLIFVRDGTYPKTGGGQGCSFRKNHIYFRHSAKSEPGDRRDLRKAFERQLNKVREAWMEGVSRVVQAPPGSQVAVHTPADDAKQLPEQRIRVVDEPDAEATRVADPDATHPYRFTDVLDEVNERLPDGESINQYDLFAVRDVHDVMDQEKFVHNFEHSTAQYSEQFIDWLMEQYARDQQFFENARQNYSQ